MKTTQRALFSSLVALILCFSMLVGTTFAWFTDGVESGVNTIVAGNLDIELYHTNRKVSNEQVTNATVLFDDVYPTVWEPGAMAYEELTVKNVGTLALKYQLSLNFENASVVNGHQLTEVLKVAVVENGFGAGFDREAAKNLNYTQRLESFSLTGELSPGASGTKTYGIVIYWEPTVNDNWFNLNNGNAGRKLSVDLGVKLVATQKSAEQDSFGSNYDGATVWYGGVDTAWYREDADTFTISTAEGLAGLARLVNTGVTSFENKAVKLTADIDMNNLNWTPIGDADADVYVGFRGTFDGQGHTISNLYIDSDSWAQGLFGYMENHAVVQNLSVHNAAVSAEDTCGVIAGYVAQTAQFSNIRITGDITVAGQEQVGVIVGHGGYATFDGCAVIAQRGSTVTAGGGFAAGSVGYHREGAHAISGCTVENLTVTGNSAVGGIVGIVGYGSVITNCTVRNVVLNKTGVGTNPSVGVFAGCWAYHPESPITLTDNVADKVTINGASAAYAAYDSMYGSEYNGKTSANFVLENNSLTNVVSNQTEVLAATPDNVQEIINNAPEGAVIGLTAGTYGTIMAKSGITLLGSRESVVGCVNLNGAQNVTLRNIAFDATRAQVAYDYAGNVKARANIIGAGKTGSVGARNIVIEGCSFTGTFANGGAAIALTDQKRPGGFSGNITIKNCTFRTEGAYYDIYGFYCGHSGMSMVIENNVFESECQGMPIYLGRFASSEAVLVTGNCFATVDSLENAAYVQPHSEGYSPALAAADNVFLGH